MAPSHLTVIEHQADCPPARVGRWLADAGGSLSICRPYRGEPIPSEVDALLVLGGGMGCEEDDRAPWLPATRDLVRRCTQQRRPVLGICLGHQIVAVALGGTVGRNPAGSSYGVRIVQWQDGSGADPVFAPAAEQTKPLIHANDDIVTRLPDGAQLLGRGEGGEVVAARFAETVWGIQGHPEIDAKIIDTWFVTDIAKGAITPEHARHIVADIRAQQDALDAAWQPVAQAFAEQLR
ncbi:type 1 glutamine amidotransferase [Janibacter sp. GXQ6167]|uniref:type 1 glutamine amidotransferase n=1 Tax=Janibacter sp. GXQ6167 TaxID=3240791 RepID=UPI003524FE45